MRESLKKLGLVCVLTLPLGGCALPAGLEVASWVITGFSYISTGKSVSDHAISAVAGEDCALHRPVTGDDFCKTLEDADPTLASGQIAENITTSDDFDLEVAGGEER